MIRRLRGALVLGLACALVAGTGSARAAQRTESLRVRMPDGVGLAATLTGQAPRSLRDPAGDIVEPYGDYGAPTHAPPGVARDYRIEFWPIGNLFRAGDRIQLTVLGASSASPLGLPAINTVGLGGTSASRLLLPSAPITLAGAAGSRLTPGIPRSRASASRCRGAGVAALSSPRAAGRSRPRRRGRAPSPCAG